MDTISTPKDPVTLPTYDHRCGNCKRTFRTDKGLKQHQRSCKHQANKGNITKYQDENCLPSIQHEITYRWGEVEDTVFEKHLNEVYEKIVYWRKNLFMLPSGHAGKSYIKETIRLLDEWNHNSSLKDIALKAIMVMPSLLLQKPSKNSKTKEHVESLDRRLILWQSGNIIELFREGQTIQDSLADFTTPKDIGQLSKQFAELMQKGNVNGAIKLLTNNMRNGILPLTKETLDLLKQKRPNPSPAQQEVLLPD